MRPEMPGACGAYNVHRSIPDQEDGQFNYAIWCRATCSEHADDVSKDLIGLPLDGIQIRSCMKADHSLFSVQAFGFLYEANKSIGMDAAHP